MGYALKMTGAVVEYNSHRYAEIYMAEIKA